MEKNLSMILVVVSRVVGLSICVSNFIAILTSIFAGSAGHMPMQGAFIFACILYFILGAALLFMAKPLSRALTA